MMSSERLSLNDYLSSDQWEWLKKKRRQVVENFRKKYPDDKAGQFASTYLDMLNDVQIASMAYQAGFLTIDQYDSIKGYSASLY